MSNTTSQQADNQRRNRTALLLLVALFFGGMLIAGALRFSGWRPEGSKNKGEFLQPYGDLREYVPILADGRPYRWTDSPRTWRILVLARDCEGPAASACSKLLLDLDKVWRLMGRHADRVHVLWGGVLPAAASGLREVHAVRVDAALQRGLPGAAAATGMPVWLVDPNGFVVLRYAPGFDPGDLRSDLARLLRIN